MQTFDIAKMQSFLICRTAKLYVISGTDCNVVLATHEVAEAAKHILLNLLDSKSHCIEGRVLYTPLLGLLQAYVHTVTVWCQYTADISYALASPYTKNGE